MPARVRFVTLVRFPREKLSQVGDAATDERIGIKNDGDEGSVGDTFASFVVVAETRGPLIQILRQAMFR